MTPKNSGLVGILNEAGLDKKQAMVYLALLEAGEATAQELAVATSVKRPTVYVALEELEELGLVLRTKLKRRTYFSPTDPKKLLEDAKSRAVHLEANLGLLEQIKGMPRKAPRVIFLKSAEGFKRVWRIIFDSGIKEYLIITDPQEMLGFVKKGYITDRIIKKKVELGIKSRQIAAFSEYTKEVVAKDARENRVSKIMPHIYKLPFTTIIFGNNVAFTSTIRENLLIIVESEEFAKTQRSIFEALWQALPERR